MEHLHQQFQARMLLVRLIENDIDEEGIRFLNRWFKEDPEAVRCYCEFLRVYAVSQLQISNKIDCQTALEDSQFDQAIWAALKEMEDAAPVVEVTVPLPVPRRSIEVPKTEKRISKRALAAAIISGAALLFMICYVHFFSPAEMSRPVASLTGSYNTLWSGTDESMPNGSRLWNDGRWYRLERGKAEITFDSGAAVLLEAPVRLEVLSENEMLFEGTLTARVPVSAHGFTVYTAHSTIVDLGTEFGVFADAQESRVFVRQGEVELEALFAPHSSLKQRISSGKGYQVDRSGTISEVVYHPDTFRWESPDLYEQAVYATNPIAYWRFDRDLQERLINEMNPKDVSGRCAGVVQRRAAGPNLGSGKPNFALRLLGRKAGEQEAIPAGLARIGGETTDWKRTGNYSIVLWFCPETPGLQSILVYSNEDTYGILSRYSDQIYLSKDNRISFYVYCPESAADNQALHSISAAEPVQLNTWYHVAVTCSAENRINLYVNGRLRAAKQLPSRPQPNLIGYIGCSTINPYYDQVEHLALSREPFCGVVDEISEYDRTLSAEEVENLYRAAGGTEERK